jgi:branched-chain amino acid transport system ATP-binding protein
MLLRIEDLWVHYGGAEILKGISLQIDEGEIVAIIGSNGAGKTTAMRAVSGLIKPTAGKIWYADKRIDLLASQQIAKTGIVQVPAGRGLFPFMTVYENLIIGAYLRKDKHNLKEDLARIYSVFPILKDRHNQHAGTLSGGQQQMLAIASAMMARPKLLLLDEPSTGLSPLMVGEVGKIISHIHMEGTTVLLIEQNAKLALGLSMRAYVLETGHIVLEGKAAELKESEHVKKAYLG